MEMKSIGESEKSNSDSASERGEQDVFIGVKDAEEEPFSKKQELFVLQSTSTLGYS
jgi:hypothetical protein